MPLSKKINNEIFNDSDYSTELENSDLIQIEKNEEIIQIETLEHNQVLAEISPNALNAVIKFHWDGEERSSFSHELFKQLALSIVSFLGVTSYLVPAEKYAESICANIINYEAGTMVVAGAILMLATNNFFDKKNAENIPLVISDPFIDPFTTPPRTNSRFATDALIPPTHANCSRCVKPIVSDWPPPMGV